MHITQLNRECLLCLFSFLDKDSRKNLSRTCSQLRDVFEDPTLWPLLHFHSLAELKKDNFRLSPALRSLSICWHSSRVQVCSIEDWLKSAFQRSICSQHESLVNDFLLQVCNRCPNLTSVTLSGCGHVTDDCLARLLLSCPRLRALRLENCARVTNRTLAAVAAHGRALQTLHVDFCRNVSAAGLLRLRAACPDLVLSAERSAAMIPDQPPRARLPAAPGVSAAPGRQSVPHPTGS
ncbi:F-box and leucine-rich protein 22 [Grammomys surdaster]|uniref:F-box and leucine-rich protein 22 n=1 Tax=Grammomys surdaster TaxID=491861 RepID=UPI0010A02D4C|nr:F-box and leucine-rich protein 22 [Grammomys surdaster]XP_028637297.1 F-box and leucine-rich protein 22 [Grammomys surdaster]